MRARSGRLLYYYYITTELLLHYYSITTLLLLYYYYITAELLLYYYCITTSLLLYHSCIAPVSLLSHYGQVGTMRLGGGSVFHNSDLTNAVDLTVDPQVTRRNAAVISP